MINYENTINYYPDYTESIIGNCLCHHPSALAIIMLNVMMVLRPLYLINCDWAFNYDIEANEDDGSLFSEKFVMIMP